MAAKKSIEALVDQALQILEALGVPLDALTARRRVKMAKAFLAIAGLKPGMPWRDAQDNDDKRQLLSRQIIAFMNAYLGESIADSSYDDIRRKDLALPEQALIVLKSAKNPDANTNDGTRGFALNPAAAKAIRAFGTPQWGKSVDHFLAGRKTLAQELRRDRDLARIPVQIKNGVSLAFSPGNHNVLQKHIIENFLTIFGFGAEVLYVGDTANKSLFLDQAGLAAIKFFELSHDKLPDVVAYSRRKNWLYLIEAVTTANPITELRRKTLKALTQDCTADVIFITAFPDRATYRKFAKDIAWETEVWIADAPEHMIHLNGDKFLGPYK
jgi:BsuBI/PstI restriction endonuclease domain/BsuBI/PstI restriction endonuclease HTH domain